MTNMSANAKTDRGATVVVHAGGGDALEHQTFVLVDQAGKRHVFDTQQVRVGAGPGNDLLLDDPTVSSVHLEIAATDRGFRARDLGSTNGTRVGGVRIGEAYLQPGQVVEVGTVPLTFEVGKETFTEPLSAQTEFCGCIGAAPAMRAIFSRVERVARTDATVLVGGETGTGKEVIAGAIYEASKRADKSFVVVDCGAIAHNLIESELFGHEKGAFTGAASRRIGAFERADGGTIFLDEIGELDLELQPKLLRVLERREFQRVGGGDTKKIDVRIIAATNRDLRAMVARGEFREDLYYRLAVVTVDVPPLRERKEDIPLLAAHFAKAMGATLDDLPQGAMARFMEHSWPGNCRELKNAVERAVVLGETRFLSSGLGAPAAAPSEAVAAATSPAEGPRGSFVVVPDIPYKKQKADLVADFEERYARLLLKEHRGNVSSAARQAGIDRMSLHKILARYNLDARELGRS